MEQQKNEADSEVERLLPGLTTPEFDYVLTELGARHSFRDQGPAADAFRNDAERLQLAA